MNDRPHRRYDPLRGEWVLVSPHRTARPWQGQVERVADEQPPQYDPSCYLCPGNERANGERNPRYSSTFAFDNDFAALQPHTAPGTEHPGPGTEHPAPGTEHPTPGTEHPSPSTHHPAPDLFLASAERGRCRVLCFSPRHDLTLPRMDPRALRAVVDMWVDECESLAASSWIQYALVFENRGKTMGASNPHPHGQIWATEHVPNEPAREAASIEQHRRRHGTCLLCEYAELEIARRERIVCDNDHFLAVVPFWAMWPFETLVIARRHVAAIRDLDDERRDALADILKRLTTRYDNLFETSFPYSMGFHQALRRDEASHLHAHFYPPLLRSATVRKFVIGFELLGTAQRDLTPEAAAARLQEAGDVHYRTRSSAGASR